MISTTSWITTLFKSVDVHIEYKWQYGEMNAKQAWVCHTVALAFIF